MKLANKHIFVTGGAKGIGEAIVRDAANEGGTVSFVDIDVLAGEKLMNELVESGKKVAFFKADVANFEELKSAFTQAVSKFSDVTGVVNNAGVNSHADPVSMTDKEWDDFFAIDMKPVWLTAKLALPAMRKAKHGSIVNICSIHGRLTYPGFFPYGAAKSAVLGLTRNLALDEGKYEIRVNAVSPGYILTDLTKTWLSGEIGRLERANSIQPLGRMGEPHEVAKVVTFLLSDKSTYVSGSDWAVDGGLGARSA
ncbi:MAG: SDR family oxidoreductase [Actinobacteria bacterium]|jgi:NAD(P)-dependent dehydrogenase (short-subunit alcohol dehydrogenase family)|nr:SDR family oxidoreductase [Actinomycetota bacterium]NBY82691.1 SDR family oxidoreductase [Actinomycetota bacterium]NCA25750.1 SDR family oxidoreductase [Actinomycetota bacterium]NCU78203.1 SDR family oxidoreductase [Actinomycetota bacterium]NCU96779.1 SDR family oxidoreductase [Actinomycetota bacterium]